VTTRVAVTVAAASLLALAGAAGVLLGWICAKCEEEL
jgi:hypothetical protein